MKACVFDIEGDGLLDEVQNIWCIVTKDWETQEVSSFEPKDIDAGLVHLQSYDVVIGHNIIYYDIPALLSVKGWQYEGKTIDTLVWSRTANPDRKLPKGCPTHAPDVEGKKRIIGAHSLAAWGYRVSRAKPVFHAWHEYSPGMLHRCSEDVEINYKTLVELMKETDIKTLEEYLA